MNQRKLLNLKRVGRGARTRARISGTAERPRLAVSRSNKYVSAQLVDDAAGRTIAHVSGADFKNRLGKKAEQARKAGELLAKRALEAGISRAVFDRGHYKYHGRLKAFVEGARGVGLEI